MGFFSFLKPKVKERSTLSPDQERVMKVAGNALANIAAAGPEYFRYKGPLVAGLRPEEEDLLRRSRSLFSTQEGTFSQLSTFDPVAFNKQFETEVARPQVEFFKRELLPLLQESAPAFSVERAKLTSRALQNLANSLLQQRFQERQAVLNRALQASTVAPQVMMQRQQIESLPRAIEQAGLDKEFQNFAQANQMFSTNLQSAISFLQPQTKAFFKEPSKFSMLTDFVQGTAGMLKTLSDIPGSISGFLKSLPGLGG